MKKISEIIKFLRENLPEELNEISSSLELLQEILNKTSNKINCQISELAKENKHEKAKEYLNKSKELSGFIKIIEQIIEEIAAASKEEVKKEDIPNYEDYYVDKTKPHYLDENYTHKRPYSFILEGKGVKVNTWVQMLIETCEILIKKDKNLFRNFIDSDDFKGRSRAYFSYSSNNMNKPQILKLDGKDLYIETNLSANDIINIIQKMIERYKINIKAYEIYLKADYTELHN